MLASLTVLIISGPTLAWLGQESELASTVLAVHLDAGNVLLILVITHFLGAMKHLMFHQDDSIVRMLWPKR
jgi:cytochrome b561